MLVSLFAPITAIAAVDHKKHFKQGLEFEEAFSASKACLVCHK
jgi:hypothetical protein